MCIRTASKREPGHLEGGLVGGRTLETLSRRGHTQVCRAAAVSALFIVMC